MPNKGPWIHRFLTIFFTLIFAVLWFWLLGFIVDDIGSWPGPSYAELERQRLDPALVTQADALQRQIADTQRRISEQKARQELLRDSTANSQTTMNQLLEFQRSSMAKNLMPSADERKALADLAIKIDDYRIEGLGRYWSARALHDAATQRGQRREIGVLQILS